jgi:hypothetical protein
MNAQNPQQFAHVANPYMPMNQQGQQQNNQGQQQNNQGHQQNNNYSSPYSYQ